MEIIKLHYDNHLSDNPEIAFELRCSIEAGLKTLVKGPTGSGKTVQIGQLAHKILDDESKSGEDQSKIILACPNVIQNRQNEKNELIAAKSFTKGENLGNKRFISAVYDKTYVAINSEEKVHLILDEAHKKVYDETYRAVALKQVGLCEDNAFSVTHITATPNILLNGIYEYDKYIICEPRSAIANNNIELFEQVVMPKESRSAIFINYLLDRCNKKDEDTVIICRLNSILEIENTISKINTFNSKIKIGKIISKEKEINPIFNSIIETGEIANEYDLVFVTSLLDVGTSIYQKNIEYIYHSRTSHDILLDDIEQAFARTRTKIKRATLTSCVEDSETELMTLKQIKSKNNKERKRVLKSINTMIKCMKELNAPREEIIDDASKRLNFEYNEVRTGLGCIQLDEDTLECFINKELAEAYDFREHDRQFYFKPKQLLNELSDRIKADKFIIQYYSNSSDEIKDLISKEKEEKKNKSELNKKEAQNIILNKNLGENLLFQELINGKDLCLDFIDEELKEDLEFLQKEESLIDNIKDLMEVGMELGQATQIAANSKKPKDIKTAKQTYQAILLNTRKRYSMVDDNFTKMHKIIREEIKPIEKRQGRITDALIEKIYSRLVDEGVLDKRKKPKNKILELINLIYNTAKIKNEKNAFKISSLKTNIQTLK